MKYELRIAPGVEIELQEILDHIERVFGTRAANNFMKAFASKIESIGSFPNLFPKSGRFLGARKCIIQNRSILYYRILDNGIVEIVTLRDGYNSMA